MNMMDDTINHGDISIVDSNGGTIDESSDIEEDREDEDKPPIRLDNIILQRLKQNDPSITGIEVALHYDSDKNCFFNSIDWKEDGDCIANNTQLKKLHISYIGTIGKVDYILGEEGHNLPTREQLRGLFSCIYQNRSITALSFSSILIYDKFGGGLIEGLSGHHSLIRLEMGHAKLGLHHSLKRLEIDHNIEIGCEALRKVVSNSKLNDLRLPYCKLDDKGLCTLCDGLLGNSIIKRLRLYGNDNITHIGWRALSAVLQHSKCKLVELDLHSTVIQDEGAEALGSAFRGSSLKSLILGHNPSISSRVWQTLLGQLSQTLVEYVDLSEAEVDDNGLAVLASIGTLKSLDLHGNISCTPTGWRSFFNSLLMRGTQLVKLDITGSRVGGSGALTLGSLLGSMNTLRSLEMGRISHNNDSDIITPQGWQALFTALLQQQEPNLDLVELNLGNNSIDDDGLQLLVRLVSSKTSLKCLSLICNRSVTPTGWQALSRLLQCPNLALEILDLDENNLNDDTVVEFASALVQNNTLKSLYLYHGDDSEDEQLIFERGWEAVSTLLCNKSSIMDTYNSNHTLQELGCDEYQYEEMNLPDDLVSYLALNENEDKVEVARQKILQTHFSSEDDATSKMQELLDMELEVMPTAIAWIGRPTPVDWKGNNVSGLSAMYNLTRRLPDVFDSSAHKKSSTAKRKRSM